MDMSYDILLCLLVINYYFIHMGLLLAYIFTPLFTVDGVFGREANSVMAAEK